MSPAAERLRYILSEDDDMPTPTLFTEMDTLQREGDELEWKESARWITRPCFLFQSRLCCWKKKKKVYSCSAFRWRFGNHLVGSPNKELWKWSHIWSIFMESVLKTWSFGCVGVQNMHIRRLAWWDTKYTTGMNVSIVTSVLTVY